MTTYRDLESLGTAIIALAGLPSDGKRQLTADRLAEILIAEVEHLYAAFIEQKWQGNGALPGDDGADAPVTLAAVPNNPGTAAPSPADLAEALAHPEGLPDLSIGGFGQMLASHPSAGPVPAVISSWCRSRGAAFDKMDQDQLWAMYVAMDDWYGQRDAQLQPTVSATTGAPVVPPGPATAPATPIYTGAPNVPAPTVPAAPVAVQSPPGAPAPAGAHASMEICPRCGTVARTGQSRFGQFWACGNRPECKQPGSDKGLIWSTPGKWLTLWAQYHQQQ